MQISRASFCNRPHLWIVSQPIEFSWYNSFLFEVFKLCDCRRSRRTAFFCKFASFEDIGGSTSEMLPDVHFQPGVIEQIYALKMYASPLSVGNSDICVKIVTESNVIQYVLHAYYDCGVGSGQKVNWSIFPEQKTVGLISERLLVPMSVFHLSPYCYLDSSTTIRIRLIKHNVVFLAANRTGLTSRFKAACLVKAACGKRNKPVASSVEQFGKVTFPSHFYDKVVNLFERKHFYYNVIQMWWKCIFLAKLQFRHIFMTL